MFNFESEKLEHSLVKKKDKREESFGCLRSSKKHVPDLFLRLAPYHTDENPGSDPVSNLGWSFMHFLHRFISM